MKAQACCRRSQTSSNSYGPATECSWSQIIAPTILRPSLALDLAVPPLSLLAILVIGMFAATALYAALVGPFWALIVSTATLVTFVLAAYLAWLTRGRDIVPIRSTFLIVHYILKKLGLYRNVFCNKTEAKWIRTDRGKSD